MDGKKDGEGPAHSLSTLATIKVKELRIQICEFFRNAGHSCKECSLFTVMQIGHQSQFSYSRKSVYITMSQFPITEQSDSE